MGVVGGGSMKEAEPYGSWHFSFWLIFLVIALSVTGLLWVLTNQALPTSISFVKNPTGFSPFLFGRVSIDYVGFGIPFIVSMVVVAVLYRRRVGGRRLSRGLVALIIIAPVSFLLSQFTPLGGLVSLGRTDLIMMAALSVVLYYNILRLSTTDSTLFAYPIGFVLGFMSDLESAGYFNGVFGGFGMGDGDFLYPLSFAIAAYFFSIAWRPLFNKMYGWQVKYEERRAERHRKQPNRSP
jgi:hypothetical protein